MSRRPRFLLSAVLLLPLVACQQAVRPNLAPANPAPAAPLPGIAVQTDLPPSAPAPRPESPPVVAPAPPSEATLNQGAVVFARINKGLGPGACAAGSNSDRWRHRYAGNPAAFARHVEQVLPLLDFVSTEVERAGLPAEFVFIPLVESWYRPEAIGPGGPAGMWQMIPSTARNHGIHIKSGYDGRLSPVESTRAALSYLKTLQGMFGSWQAIVMAYNAGEGRMMRAFKRSENRDASAARRKPHGLSNITYDYVAKLQALSCLIAEPEKQGLKLPMAVEFRPLAPVLMGAEIRTLEQFAATQGSNAAELRQLNPGYKNGRVIADVPRLVLTPLRTSQTAPSQAGTSTVATATVEMPAQTTGGAPERALTHQVTTGDSLWSVAKLHSISIEQLRRINRLGRSSTVRPGQTLKLVP